MKILLLAPQPFYQERGTPIAVDLLLKVFSGRGDTVDLLTYREGEDRKYPGVTIHRIPRFPGTTNIRPGFSVKKVICNIPFFFKAIGMAAHGKYDVVHAVEESVFTAMWLRALFRLRYVYDMDSSLSQQLAESRAIFRLFRPVTAWLERAAIKKAAAVIAVCDELGQLAMRSGAKKVDILPDISLLDVPGQSTQSVELPPWQGKTLMYIGNLERYQGIDLLLESFAAVLCKKQDVRLVIVGGAPDHVAHYTHRAGELGIRQNTVFMGPRPLSAMASLFEKADVLVSPRIRGINTPMKIYSYLDSGKPIVATDLPTHTQVLTSDMAMLAKPSPNDFAAGMLALSNDPELCARLARNAREFARARHSFEAFKKILSELYDSVGGGLVPHSRIRSPQPR